MDVNTMKPPGLKYKVVCCFKLAVDMVECGIREFVHDADTPAFLKRELKGYGMDGYNCEL